MNKQQKKHAQANIYTGGLEVVAYMSMDPDYRRMYTEVHGIAEKMDRLRRRGIEAAGYLAHAMEHTAQTFIDGHPNISGAASMAEMLQIATEFRTLKEVYFPMLTVVLGPDLVKQIKAKTAELAGDDAAGEERGL